MGEFLSIRRRSAQVGVIFLACASLIFVQLAEAQSSQEGFLSIDCGAETSYTDKETTIQWQPDARFISTGYTVPVESSPGDNITSMFSEFTTMRVFNDLSYPKYCYSLPVTDNGNYSLRATFFYGTSEAAGPEPPSFQYIRTQARLNFGGMSRVRFPTDVHDRYWYPVGPNSTYLQNNSTPIQVLSTTQKIDLTDYGTSVPEVVLQTAVTGKGNITIEDLNFASPKSHLVLHFAELDSHTSNVSRKFMVQVPSVATNSYVNPWNFSVQPFKPMFWYFWGVSLTSDSDKILLYPRPRSRLGPLLNALELFSIIDIAAYTTFPQDAQAIETIKTIMNLTEWTGDPCLPVPHSWVNCTAPAATLQPRVDQLSLSGYRLAGAIPGSSFALMDLSSLSLDTNALTGPFPDLGSMTTLQQLHLHNNQLSGPLPDWLVNMANLQELSIQNNNFSGVIPAQLLARNSLNFTYRPGNPLLVEPSSALNNTVGGAGTKHVAQMAYIFVTVILTTLRRSIPAMLS